MSDTFKSPGFNFLKRFKLPAILILILNLFCARGFSTLIICNNGLTPENTESKIIQQPNSSQKRTETLALQFKFAAPPQPLRARPINASWNKDGTLLAVSTHDGAVHFYDPSGKLVRVLEMKSLSNVQRLIDSENATSVAWGEGTQIAFGLSDGRVFVFESPFAEVPQLEINLQSLDRHPAYISVGIVKHLSFDPTGTTLFVIRANSPSVFIYKKNFLGKWRDRPWHSIDIDEHIVSVRIKSDPTGTTDTKTEVKLAKIAERASITKARISPNGKWFAVADRFGRVFLYDLRKNQLEQLKKLSQEDLSETRAQLELHPAHLHSVQALEWSVDSTRLASASFDGDIRVWQIQDNTSVMGFANQESLNSKLTISGFRYSFALEDPLYVSRDPQRKDIKHAHASGVVALAWSPTGEFLGSADQGGRVKLWNFSETDGSLKGELFEAKSKVEYINFDGDHTSIVSSLEWHQDGSDTHLLSSSSMDAIVQLRRMESNPIDRKLSTPVVYPLLNPDYLGNTGNKRVPFNQGHIVKALWNPKSPLLTVIDSKTLTFWTPMTP